MLNFIYKQGCAVTLSEMSRMLNIIYVQGCAVTPSEMFSIVFCQAVLFRPSLHSPAYIPRVGHTHFIGMHSAHTIFLARKAPYDRIRCRHMVLANRACIT
jgi:hypothetical protein